MSSKLYTHADLLARFSWLDKKAIEEIQYEGWNQILYGLFTCIEERIKFPFKVASHRLLGLKKN